MTAQKHMRPESHDRDTVIQVMAKAMRQWQRATGLSMATLVDGVVSAHARIGADAVTDIVFDPATRDTHDRMRINAERVTRWLDELTKSTNLMPANFLPSMLAALPQDLRLEAANAILQPSGLAAHPLAHAVHVDPGDAQDMTVFFRMMLAEGRESELAVVDLLDGIEAGELERAQRELSEDIAARQAALHEVERRLKETE